MEALLVISYVLALNPNVMMREFVEVGTRLVCEMEEGLLNTPRPFGEPPKILNRYNNEVYLIGAECFDIPENMRIDK